MYNLFMKNNKQIIRKKNRLKGYDYSSNASYFLTVCSDKRKEIFSQIVFDNTVGANIVRLSKIGQKIENCILKIEEIYPCVFVDNYIIMPNHIHLILTIDTRRRPMVARRPLRHLLRKCHRLAAARSRRGSDSPPGCHSTPRRRFATLRRGGKPLRRGLSGVPLSI